MLAAYSDSAAATADALQLGAEDSYHGSCSGGKQSGLATPSAGGGSAQASNGHYGTILEPAPDPGDGGPIGSSPCQETLMIRGVRGCLNLFRLHRKPGSSP